MAVYPSNTPSDADLYVALDNFGTTLNGAIDDSQTTITLTSTVGLPTVGILTVESEKIKYTGISGNDITGCVRGFSSTTNSSHANGVTVEFNVVEEHHNTLKDEVIAIATDNRNTFSADLNDSISPTATAVSLKERLDMVVTRIKEIIGASDWKDAISVALTGKKTVATGNAYRFETTDVSGNLQETSVTASRSVVTDANGLPSASLTTSTEIGYVSGVTSSIQTQITDIKKNLPNILVNGGFEIWQRNSSFSNPVANYLADHWRADVTTATPTWTVSKESGASNIDSENFSAKVDVTAVGASTGVFLLQFIENYKAYLGKTVSLSARIKTSTANKINIRINDGVGETISTNHTGSGNFETLTVTHTVSSSATRLLISVGFHVTSLVVSTFYADSAMLIENPASTDFVAENPTTLMERCQRYYEKSYALTTNPGTITNLGRQAFASNGLVASTTYVGRAFITTKYAAPTVTIYATSTGNSGNVSQDNGADVVATVNNTNEKGYDISWTNGVGRFGGWWHYTAESEL
jgi:hypothetical protein